MVFSRHLYFVDYTQYGCDIQYFNMVSIVVHSKSGIRSEELLKLSIWHKGKKGGKGGI